MTVALAATLQFEAPAEAARVLTWWSDHLSDPSGGFFGEIDAKDVPVAGAHKSVILNTRLLWYFSAMARHTGSASALALAHRANSYLRAHFVDEGAGGVFWQLDSQGRVTDGKKQAYAQAFAIYALTEFHLASQAADALQLACDLQDLVEAHYWDTDTGGYIEALDRNWQPLADLRLSEKDLDAPKTMNTHLHVLEAYTLLHRVVNAEKTRQRLARALSLFLDLFVGADGHLRLFFDMDWTDRTRSVSFGHDIEASWLIWEAAEALGDPGFCARARPAVLALARTALSEGLGDEGGLAYERDGAGHLDRDGEWWGQAEALVGFVNAWQMTGDRAWLDAAEQVWRYTKAQYGAGGATEWTWYPRNAERPPVYKAGTWKCPYHNGRALIELTNRLHERA